MRLQKAQASYTGLVLHLIVVCRHRDSFHETAIIRGSSSREQTRKPKIRLMQSPRQQQQQQQGRKNEEATLS
jgi:hypothetical protein